RPGTYRVELVVSDGRLESAAASIFVEITGADASSAKQTENAKDTGKAVLLRRVNLAIWPPEPDADGNIVVPEDSGLERAVQMFSARCGIGLAVNPSVARPGQFTKF